MRIKTFGEALKKLDIEDYGEKIFHSNSHGELIHISDYIHLANLSNDMTWFRNWFIRIVNSAERTWKRPESVFQHIFRILREVLKEVNK